ncbi:MAG: regulator of sigma protease [Clostridia bacterium]|nr:regulator of sigma protease [Clostridia bacterium]
MTILLAVIVFGVLILVHELGHFLAAKKAGIKVEEFSIGLGPAIGQFRRGETLYSLRLLPLGGYNKMAGWDTGEWDDPRGFNRQPLRWRMGVIGAGSAMNFVLALALFIFVFMVLGIPSDKSVIGKVVPGLPAAAAGIQPGDRVLAIEGVKVNTWREMVEQIYSRPEQEISLVIERAGQKREITLRTARDLRSGVGIIGVEPRWERQGLLRSIALGIQQTVAITTLILASLIQMLTGQIAPEVVGPVGIVQLVGQAASFGLANVLNFIAVLSVDLGIINLFPIPALDGSRLVFLAIEGIRGRPIDPEKENIIHFIGFALLMALLLFITYKDILRLIG